MAELRRLINSAYRVLGEMGLNFTGVDQDEEITRQRMRGREVYVVERDGTLIGTVTLSVKRKETEAHVHVNQLAVHPAHQRQGIGSALMELAEQRARELGIDRVRLDTAIDAAHLVRWYGARGYVAVDEAQWKGKTYRSVIMEKRVTTA